MKELSETAYLALLILVAIPSLIGSLFIIVTYFTTRADANLAQKLILTLAISDSLFVFANLVAPNPKSDDFACQFQAWLKQASSQSSFIASFLISLFIYKSIIAGYQITYYYEKLAKLLCIVPPFITATLPLMSNGYTNTPYSCSFNEKNTQWIEGLILFYIPLVSLTTASIVLVVKVIKFLEYLENQSNQKGNVNRVNRLLFLQEKMEILQSKKIIQLIVMYPIILALCWAPYVIYACIKVITGKEFLWLQGLRFIFACLQGFLNSIVHQLSRKYKVDNKVEEPFSSFISDESQQDDFYRASKLIL